MSETLSEALKTLGLSAPQIVKLAALQEAGRKIDFVYQYSDDGRDPSRTADRFDEFRFSLKAFSEEGEVSRRAAAALWDHVVPRFVGWRPEFIEGVEVRELRGVLTSLDSEIDAKLGRAIPTELRGASQEVKTRFDDLLIAYEAGTRRDTRTPGEIRDELYFVAALDEKIRNVLYGDARSIDLRSTIEDYRPLRAPGDRYQSDSAYEAQAYQAQLANVADVVDRIRMAGIEVRSGLTIHTRSETPQTFAVDLGKELREARVAPSLDREQRLGVSEPAADEKQYWLGVAQAAGVSAGLARSESQVQGARRGRSS